jgi:hypothetical protein
MGRAFMATIWAFLIYWMVAFVGCYIVVEVGQDQLYDEVTPHVGLKVTGGSLILAILMTWLKPSYLSMFTTSFAWTVLQAIVWFGVFTLIFQFHPWHGLGLGIATMLLISGLATMGVESILTPTPAAVNRSVASQVSKPVRESLSPAAAQPKPAEPKK